ncbi:MAG: hypothetical protein MUE73_01225 [Planctomycetes bacterium]|jgi:hypothetical protein|nr:hypothetical protein [Planctomycetota bacterium]
MRRILLLIPVLLGACGEASPVEAEARRILAGNGASAIRSAADRASRWWSLDVWPDLSVRGECPEATPLRRWFEERGLNDSMWMDEVLFEGVLDLARWRAVDWGARVREAARKAGPRPLLPVIGPTIEWRDCEPDRRVILTVEANGEIRCKGLRVSPGSLAETLWPFAEAGRSDSGERCRTALLLLGDRRAPFRVLRPVFEACRHSNIRINRIRFGVYRGNTDYLQEIRTWMPFGTDGNPDRPEPVYRVVLPAAPDPMPAHEALVGALRRPGNGEASAILTIDPVTPIQRVADILAAFHEARIWQVDYAEATSPSKTLTVTVDGVPVSTPAK